ncbi:MAG: Rrf2 family transcriptional regulator [Candidatus Omnitrophica bacterium]|nr:Rrf2 family transcriptional regulator [Candidatus Omnitrophota bacterium]
MLITQEVENAARVIYELASRWPSDEPVAGAAIRERQKIPEKDFKRVTALLEKKRIIRKTGGRLAGYSLYVAPRLLSMEFLILQLGGGVCHSGGSHQGASGKSCLSHVFARINHSISRYLGSITFEDLVDGSDSRLDVYDYQI